MKIARVPVSPKTCTVNGFSVKASSPAWAGLDLSKAEPRYQNSMMLMVAGSEGAGRDIHLDVPWCHPGDQTGSPDDFDCRYRVRPKAEIGEKWKGRVVEDVAFERWNGDWFIMIRTEPKL